MSPLSNQSYGNDRRPRAHLGLEAALHAFMRLNIGVVVVTLAARSLHSRFSAYETLLLGGALAVTAGFGLTMGLLAGAVALMVIYRAWGGGLSVDSLRAEDLLFVLAFGATVAGVGHFTDEARRRGPTWRSSPSRSSSALPPPPPAARSFKVVGPLRRAALLTQGRRTLAGFALALAGGAAAIRFHAALGPTWTLPLVLAPALVAAEWTGGARGLLIAGLAATLLVALFPAAGTGGELSRVLGVVMVSVFGLRIGLLGEAFRRNRDARAALERAGASFSSCGDEAGIRSALAQSLLRLDPRARIEVCDVPAGPADPGVQVRRLLADGRDFGEVRWWFSAAVTDRRAADDTAAALIDMAACAIVRARLSAERADMETAMRAEQLRTILLDAVSHHFRSPLAGILGSVTSILSLPEPHDRGVDHEFLLIIKEQANRLSRYVDNFLSLARLEAGAIEVNPSEVNLEELIYDVWDSFGASGGARRYLQVDLDVEVVRSDASLLTQIFGNILENAIKYSPEESIVAVSGARRPDGLLIEIVDEGRGVPEAALERMFGRFHRVQAGETPGMGLGLYITRSLVEILGGKVSARNRSDGQTGLIISIALPRTTTHS